MTHERFSMSDEWELEDPEQDVRGRTVVDQTGSPIGTVTDMLVDSATESIDAVVLDSGRELPMNALDVDADTVRYRDGAEGTYGRYDDTSTGQLPDEGYDATAGVASGDATTATSATGEIASGRGMTGDQDGGRVALREEELQARTTRGQAGQVVIDKDVVEEQRSIDVPVTHDEVVIQRRPVSGQTGSAGDLGDATSDSIRVPVMAEQVEVSKQPRVVEELEISKRPVTETQRVSDTVRRETADVRDEGDVDFVGDPSQVRDRR
jgi:uncharacterized protein (TIGR02271 family)